MKDLGNLPKTTNLGWPDPTDWANRLHLAMAERQAVYDKQVDPLTKRNQVGGMLGLIISSLLELPAFKNDSVHLPLKDLMIFLSDLDRGRDHPWSSPVNFGGTNITTTAQAELKTWVRAAYEVLRDNDFKPVEAYRRIARGLTESGRSGRKGMPVRWQRVQAWCLEAEEPRDIHVRRTVARWWADLREQTAAINVVDDWGKPVLEREIAGKFADLCWGLPHLRDQSFSGESE
jgi:hypothetical protein